MRDRCCSPGPPAKNPTEPRLLRGRFLLEQALFDRSVRSPVSSGQPSPYDATIGLRVLSSRLRSGQPRLPSCPPRRVLPGDSPSPSWYEGHEDVSHPRWPMLRARSLAEPSLQSVFSTPQAPLSDWCPAQAEPLQRLLLSVSAGKGRCSFLLPENLGKLPTVSLYVLYSGVTIGNAPHHVPAKGRVTLDVPGGECEWRKTPGYGGGG